MQSILAALYGALLVAVVGGAVRADLLLARIERVAREQATSRAAVATMNRAMALSSGRAGAGKGNIKGKGWEQQQQQEEQHNLSMSSSGRHHRGVSALQWHASDRRGSGRGRDGVQLLPSPRTPEGD